jgi:hypothetical protein
MSCEHKWEQFGKFTNFLNRKGNYTKRYRKCMECGECQKIMRTFYKNPNAHMGMSIRIWWEPIDIRKEVLDAL